MLRSLPKKRTPGQTCECGKKMDRKFIDYHYDKGRVKRNFALWQCPKCKTVEITK